jgi:hypothetical protein
MKQVAEEDEDPDIVNEPPPAPGAPTTAGKFDAV